MKTWYKSKTVWFNIFTLIVVIATTIIDSDLFKNPAVASSLGLVISVVNVVLRMFFTEDKIQPPFGPSPAPSH